MTQKQDDQVLEPENILDDLFDEAQLAQAARNPKHKRTSDPSLRNALDATAKKMRELYTLPENWEAKRGIALIEKGTQTLVGNFREYVHRSVPHTRKLLREHAPISIDLTEVVDGYLGENFEQKYRGISWEREVEATIDVWMDDLMVGAPKVKFNLKVRLGAIMRADLAADVQFANEPGTVLLQLPAGTNVLEQLSVDTKTHLRRQVNG